MKKTAIILLLSAMTLEISAQTAFDALTLSRNNYEGTARSVAMGNAFTALGGDLGGVTINPAGSAVANYSQITVTPALTFSSCTSSGVSPYAGGGLPYFDRTMKNSTTKFSIPNIGFTINWNTGREYGLKNVTFGFIVNKTADWNQDIYASGISTGTSFMGQIAAQATALGYSRAALEADDALYNPPAGAQNWWKSVIGYQTGMIATYDGSDDRYVAASQKFFNNTSTGQPEIVTAGELDQTYGRRILGNKYEYIINAGANISDFLYIGLNLGVNTISYIDNWYFKEAAVYPEDFKIEYDTDGDGNTDSSSELNRMKYQSNYSMEGTGYFAKFGFILNPGAGIRVGAAIQTPTLTTINETWQESGETAFTSGSKPENYYLSSDLGENSWSFTSPLRVNAGLAYTIGRYGVVSADYEFCNYSSIRYKDSAGTPLEDLQWINDDIRNAFRTSHMLRLGLEAKPVEYLAIRAGYGFETSAERLLDRMNHNISFGLGYSSKGSFFADLACRTSLMGAEFFMPYDDYDNSKGEVVYAPEIKVKTSLWKVFMTLGWRF